MGQLRDRMDQDLRLAGYATSTRKMYLQCAKSFASYHMRSPEQMGEEEIRAYLLHMVVDRQIARGTYGQIRASLKFLYATTLHRPTEAAHVPLQRKRVVLPVVLDRSEMQALLRAIRNRTYAGIAMVLYSAGLRIAEACSLRAADIDSGRMVIHVRCGKGARDRYTVLSLTVLEYLRDYWRSDRPRSEWLFPGQTTAGHASPEVARRVLHKAATDAGIDKRVTPHVLRHSFATHLVEAGTDITVVKALLGHASVQTTQVYTHVSVEHLGKVTSPLDLLAAATKPNRRQR